MARVSSSQEIDKYPADGGKNKRTKTGSLSLSLRGWNHWHVRQDRYFLPLPFPLSVPLSRCVSSSRTRPTRVERLCPCIPCASRGVSGQRDTPSETFRRYAVGVPFRFPESGEEERERERRRGREKKETNSRNYLKWQAFRGPPPSPRYWRSSKVSGHSRVCEAIITLDARCPSPICHRLPR